jgi:hypothetical protein
VLGMAGDVDMAVVDEGVEMIELVVTMFEGL